MEIQEWRRLALRSVGLLLFVLGISLLGGLHSEGRGSSAWDGREESGLGGVNRVEAHSTTLEDWESMGYRYLEISKTVTGSAVHAVLTEEPMEKTLTLTIEGKNRLRKEDAVYHKDTRTVAASAFGSGCPVRSVERLREGKSIRLIFHMNHVYVPTLAETEDAYGILLQRPGEVYKRVVVIDAGHGGDDQGTGSVGWKYREKTYALQIVKRMKKILAQTDIKAYYTRLDDREVSKEDRVALANDVQADAFLSIHCNSSGQTETTAQGIETLYAGQDSSADMLTGKKLAKNILDAVCEETGRKRRKVIRRGNLYLLRHSQVPVTIIETGYMTNTSDMRYLRSQVGQNALAEGICRGLDQSISS